MAVHVVQNSIGVAAALAAAVKAAGEDGPSLSAKGGPHSVKVRANGDEWQFNFNGAAVTVGTEWVKLGNEGKMAGKRFTDGIYFLASDAGVDKSLIGYSPNRGGGRKSGAATKSTTAMARFEAAQKELADAKQLVTDLEEALPKLEKAAQDEAKEMAEQAKAALAESFKVIRAALSPEEIKALLAGLTAEEPAEQEGEEE